MQIPEQSSVKEFRYGKLCKYMPRIWKNRCNAPISTFELKAFCALELILAVTLFNWLFLILIVISNKNLF